MALTANTYNLVTLPTHGTPFYKSMQSEDISDCENIMDAESGRAHYLTFLSVRMDAAVDVTIGSGESGDDVETDHIGPVPLSAESGFLPWKAPDGMGLKCTVGAALTIQAGAGTVWVEARGITSP